ncbi:MAG TPA: DNA-directed RNA polymerase subunit H [Candidatus Nanoarchaeia archaeon]|nr:DNA-directed RNA polymerase subunit H [Candidatus Nanoarchaeia archaeon]
MAKRKFDVGKHVLVPEHSKVSEKEKESVLSQFGVELRFLPEIKKKDPAIRSLNPRLGDVIKIVRKSPTAGTATYYRVVVNA